MKKEEKFSFDTIEDFDKHIDISIPNYSGLIEHVVDISTYFAKKDGLCYDIGCSTGKLLKKIEERNKDHFESPMVYVGIDKSENLLDQVHKFESIENIMFNEEDLEDFKFIEHDLSLSIFTLQFLSLELRKKVVENVYSNLSKGGAFIVAEKCFHENGYYQDIFNFTYYDFKRKSFEYKEILEKQKDLRHIMRPITSDENEQMFKDAGFKKIETFWQSLQFKAWLLIK